MNVAPGTIARTVVLLIALINQVCAIMGWIPLDISEDTVYAAVTAIATVAAAVWAFWKNNSFTTAAIQADDQLKKLKKNV